MEEQIIKSEPLSKLYKFLRVTHFLIFTNIRVSLTTSGRSGVGRKNGKNVVERKSSLTGGRKRSIQQGC